MAQTAEKQDNADNKYHFTGRELAYVFDVSVRRVQIYAREGMPKLSHGLYHLKHCHLWRCEQIAERKGGNPETGEVDEKRALIRAQTMKYETETQRLRGELLEAETVEHILNEIAAQVSSQLDGLAPRISGHLLGMKTQAEIQAAIFTETRQLRSSLADKLESYSKTLKIKKRRSDK